MELYLIFHFSWITFEAVPFSITHLSMLAEKGLWILDPEFQNSVLFHQICKITLN